MTSKKKPHTLCTDKTLSLVSMYIGIDLNGKLHQKESLQCLMLLDNIQDFTHNRST